VPHQVDVLGQAHMMKGRLDEPAVPQVRRLGLGDHVGALRPEPDADDLTAASALSNSLAGTSNSVAQTSNSVAGASNSPSRPDAGEDGAGLCVAEQRSPPGTRLGAAICRILRLVIRFAVR
jgi:hypothetical protein